MRKREAVVCFTVVAGFFAAVVSLRSDAAAQVQQRPGQNVRQLAEVIIADCGDHGVSTRLKQDRRTCIMDRVSRFCTEAGWNVANCGPIVHRVIVKKIWEKRT